MPDEWPELMAEFVKKHAGQDRDFMAELIALGDADDPFEKLLERIFEIGCAFALQDLRNAVDDGDMNKLRLIGIKGGLAA